jgi:hypothetical protein
MILHHAPPIHQARRAFVAGFGNDAHLTKAKIRRRKFKD